METSVRILKIKQALNKLHRCTKHKFIYELRYTLDKVEPRLYKRGKHRCKKCGAKIYVK